MSGRPGQDERSTIRWRVHLRSPPEAVYAMLATAEGRARFWSESAAERDGVIRFVFANGTELDAPILEAAPPRAFAVAYFGGRAVRFALAPDGDGGCDLTLVERDVPADDRPHHRPGWITVLLALKAAVEFGVDLRNHSASRTWAQGYVDV